MPITFFAGLIASLSISGVPPFNGFFSKWMIYQGLIEKGKSGGVLWVVCLVAAMFGSGLTLASFIKLIHAIFLGTPSSERRGTNDEVKWQMWVPVVILAVLCVIFGIFAYKVPLKYFITPALSNGLSFIGLWPSLKATLFLFIGLLVGVIIYLAGNFKGVRVSDSYIGGEKVQDDMRLSGTEFYNTVKEYGLESVFATRSVSVVVKVAVYAPAKTFAGNVTFAVNNFVSPTATV